LAHISLTGVSRRLLELRTRRVPWCATMQAVLAFLHDTPLKQAGVIRTEIANILETTPVTEDNVSDSLGTLNLDDSRHVVALVVVLERYLTHSGASAVKVPVVVKALIKLTGSIGLTTGALRAVLSELQALSSALRNFIVSDEEDGDLFLDGMRIFKRFINVLVNNKGSFVLDLTPLHADVMETCVALRKYEYAREFIENFTKVMRLNTSQTGAAVEHHLIFWYLSGQVYTYFNEYHKARTCYSICLSTPALEASAIAVAAVMKYAFCSMLLREKTDHIPVNAPSCLHSEIQDEAHLQFREIVDAFAKRDINEYRSCIEARRPYLERTSNYGLAKQVTLAMQMRVIEDMPAVYSKVPLAKVCEDASFADISDARRVVSDMIQTDSLQASISQPTSDGVGDVVTFWTSSNKPDHHRARLGRLMARYQQAVVEIKQVQSMLDELRVDATALAELAKFKKTNPNAAFSQSELGSIESETLAAALDASRQGV